jgi:hypothetical protein
MEVIIIDNINYISYDNIILSNPEFSKKYSSSKELLKHKKINSNNYMYVRLINNIWTKVEGKPGKNDKLIIKQDIFNDDTNTDFELIKGVTYDSIHELLSISARPLTCIYLTAFNTVRELRNVINIDNKFNENDIVYKFGLTKSFEVRKNGHKSEYKKFEDYIDMKLVYYSYIDPIYISEAEIDVKTLLSEYKLIPPLEHHEELIVIPNNFLKIVKSIYENIGMKYSGFNEDLNKRMIENDCKYNLLMKDLSTQKIIFDKEKELYELKLYNKDMEIENLKKEIKIKELELLIKNN